MRATNSMLARQLMSNLNLNYQKLMKHQHQVSTGKAFQRPSESPYDAVQLIQLRGQLGRLDQYQKNVKSAQAVVNDTEDGLAVINESLVQVKEIINRGLNGTYSSLERESMAQVVESLKETVLSEVNRAFAGNFLFGGRNKAGQLFTMIDGEVAYNNIKLNEMTTEQYEMFKNDRNMINIAKGTQIDISLPGVEITGHGQDNLFKMLDDLALELRNNTLDTDAVLALNDKNEGFINTIQNNISKIGGRTIRLDTMEKNLIDSHFNLQGLYSQIEGVDIEKAVTDFKMAEMVYNAALAVGAQIVQPTLVNYMS